MEKVIKRESEVIQTLRSDGRPGEVLPKYEYDTWSSFVLSSLAAAEDLTLNDILERAYQRAAEQSAGRRDISKTGWYILQIKRDLEARGLITVMPVPSKKHTFFIKLTRQGLSKIHYELQVSEWSEGDL